MHSLIGKIYQYTTKATAFCILKQSCKLVQYKEMQPQYTVFRQQDKKI